MKRKIILTACLLVIFITGAWCADAKVYPVVLQTEVPGNLFYAGEKVVVKMVLPANADEEPSKATVSLFDENNSLLRKRDIPVPDEKGARGTDKIGKLPPGYYTYVVEFIFPGESTSSEFLKFGVIREPERIFTPGESPFGIDAFMSWRLSDADTMENACEIMHRTGIEWVRDRISWNHIQPEPGKWEWERYDRTQQIQEDHDLNILQVHGDTAAWASTKEIGPESLRKKYPAENSLNWYQFAWKCAERYQKTTPAWEIWNEFDIPVFFLGTADEYAGVLKAASLGLEGGNPDVKVLSGSVTFGTGEISWGPDTFQDEEGVRYIEKLFENGGGEYFDIFNVHHYGPVDGLAGKIRLCRDIMHRYGYKKPIWLTEIGERTENQFMTRAVTESELEQARYLVKSYALGLSSGADKVFYFSLPDFVEHEVSNWGVMVQENKRWNPKPSLVALANLINSLDGRRYYARYETHLPVTALIFSGEKDGCMILWSGDGKSHKASVFFDGVQEETFLRTMLGGETMRENVKVETITVGPDPVFLSGFDVFDVDRNNVLKPMLEKEKKQPVFSDRIREIWTEIRTPDEKIGIHTRTVTGEVHLYNILAESRTGMLHLRMESPDGEQISLLKREVQADSLKRIPTDFKAVIKKEWISDMSGPGGGELKLAAWFSDSENGKMSTPAVRYLSLQKPVEISPAGLLPPRFDNLKTTITLTNLTDSILNTEVQIDILGRYKTRKPRSSLNLKAGDSKSLSFPLETIPTTVKSKTKPQAVIYAGGDGTTFTKTTLLETSGIPRTFLPFEIDGIPDGWSSFPAHFLMNRENIVQGADFISDGNVPQGRFYLAWDTAYLYIYFLAADDEIVNPARTTHPWTGDALEIFLDLRSGDSFGKPEYGDGVYQIFAVPPDQYHEKPFMKIWQPDGYEIENAKLASAVGEGLWALEIALPWKELGVESVETGREIGLDIVMDDIDRGDYSFRQMVWRGGANNWRNPSLLARMTLVRHLP